MWISEPGILRNLGLGIGLQKKDAGGSRNPAPGYPSLLVIIAGNVPLIRNAGRKRGTKLIIIRKNVNLELSAVLPAGVIMGCGLLW
jgi:hypothetical protein